MLTFILCFIVVGVVLWWLLKPYGTEDIVIHILIITLPVITLPVGIITCLLLPEDVVVYTTEHSLAPLDNNGGYVYYNITTEEYIIKPVGHEFPIHLPYSSVDLKHTGSTIRFEERRTERKDSFYNWWTIDKTDVPHLLVVPDSNIVFKNTPNY